ncbi:MAG: succinylglutamate desuccinylase/aspartoacylase family protein [Myxococcales bacterium]|nr:succinylglutamate desuccinylase/aspartoacylase family protein [Myxococcales bacterium]
MLETPGRHVHHLELDLIEPGRTERLWLHLVNDKLGEPVRIPLVVVRGRHEGPVLGLTAAIHGNELNGIPIIQALSRELDPDTLRGTVVGALAVNIPGLLLEQREFNDGQDLNRMGPGDAQGTTSQIYFHRLVDRIVSHFDYHVDLHTASRGRINSHYVRADMDDPVTARMARLCNPHIIVHNVPADRTLRGSAASRGIKSVTVELQDPSVFQEAVIEDGLMGIRNLMVDLGMLEGWIVCPTDETVLCRSSQWLYTDEGGILYVWPKVRQMVSEDEVIAEVRTIFGRTVKQYQAPWAGVVVGKSVNPLNQTGSRILHLGRDLTWLPCVTDDDEASVPLRDAR